MKLSEAIELTFEVREKWRSGNGSGTARTNTNHCLRILGDIEIDSIKPSTFTKLGRAIVAEGKKPATANRIMAALHTVLYECHLEDELQNVPSYRRLDEPEPHKGFYTKEQLKMLLDESLTMPDGLLLHRSLMFLYLTGCRKSELLNIKWLAHDQHGREWKCVDFENNAIHFLDTKNGTRHQLTIHPTLRPMLEEMYHERLDDDCLFPWVNKDSIYNRLCQLLRHVGLPEVKRPIHQIRHSTATHLITAGVPLEHVQSVLNHKDRTTTQGYAKTEDCVKNAAVYNLEI